jgi:hypothetical protein
MVWEMLQTQRTFCGLLQPGYFEKWYWYICAATLRSLCSWLCTLLLYSTACHAMSFLLPCKDFNEQIACESCSHIRNQKTYCKSFFYTSSQFCTRLQSNSMKFTSQDGSWPWQRSSSPSSLPCTCWLAWLGEKRSLETWEKFDSCCWLLNNVK